MNKTLIIVDPQYDFIEGGKLSVEGGTKALDNIVKYLKHGDISTVIITQDWHQGKHESFKTEGGQWPEHCVKNTHGADIYKPILDAIEDQHLFCMYLKKGEHLEEYTAFKGMTSRFEKHWIEYLTSDDDIPYIMFHEDEIIQICGLAGDVCVMNTAIALKNINPVIIDSLTASIDENNFRYLADQNNITIIDVDLYD